jgi:hypothetical protein
MALRDNPYSAFNFMVKLGDAGGEGIAGGAGFPLRVILGL